MKEITKENYEAWLLDFAEGNLSPEEAQALQTFLQAHPELNHEAQDIDLIRIEPEATGSNPTWMHLRKPDYQNDGAARESLFFAAAEGILTPEESIALKALLHTEKYSQEYEQWLSTRLKKSEAQFEGKEALYHFGHELPLNEETFDDHLIAWSEGLLTPSQVGAIQAFAKNNPEMLKAVKLAHRLRLEAPSGIVFPDKEKLYRKEGLVIGMWYRWVAAAAAVFLGIALWWLAPATIESTYIARMVKLPVDTGKVDTNRPSLHELNQETPAIQQPAIEEWEMREPDQLPVAYAPEKAPAPATPFTEIPLKQRDTLPVHTNEPEMADTRPVNDPAEEKHATPHERPVDAYADHAVPGTGYKTIAEIAEEKLRQALSLSDEEKDALAIAIAKRAAEKAGNAMDAEFSRERNSTDQGENLTYTLRFKSIKVTHSRNR